MNTQLDAKENLLEQIVEEYYIIIYNDDINTFDFVIETLMEVCAHEYMQAVQCTHIIHNNGKCHVKRGAFKDLRPMCETLIDKGLSATIE